MTQPTSANHAKKAHSKYYNFQQKRNTKNPPANSIKEKKILLQSMINDGSFRNAETQFFIENMANMMKHLKEQGIVRNL